MNEVSIKKWFIDNNFIKNAITTTSPSSYKSIGNSDTSYKDYVSTEYWQKLDDYSQSVSLEDFKFIDTYDIAGADISSIYGPQKVSGQYAYVNVYQLANIPKTVYSDYKFVRSEIALNITTDLLSYVNNLDALQSNDGTYLYGYVHYISDYIYGASISTTTGNKTATTGLLNSSYETYSPQILVDNAIIDSSIVFISNDIYILFMMKNCTTAHSHSVSGTFKSLYNDYHYPINDIAVEFTVPSSFILADINPQVNAITFGGETESDVEDKIQIKMPTAFTDGKSSLNFNFITSSGSLANLDTGKYLVCNDNLTLRRGSNAIIANSGDILIVNKTPQSRYDSSTEVNEPQRTIIHCHDGNIQLYVV